MPSFPFLGGSSNGRSPSFDAGRCINLFLVPSESDASRSPAMLIGTPGLELWLELDGGPIRGVIPFSATLSVWVAGRNIYTVTEGKVATLIGSAVDSGPCVSMASNGTTVMMVDGPFGYFIDPVAATVDQITNENFHGGTTVDFIAGYFIWNEPSSGRFWISGLYATTIDGTDFATAEGSPDNLRAVIVDHKEAWLFGDDSTEVWYLNGNTDFPLGPIGGVFLEVGILAPFTLAKADNSIFWLATDERGFGWIARANGYTPVRVSNRAVEYAIAQYRKEGALSDAVAYTYEQEGATFYVISFPSANAGAGATWVLDISTKLWHERAWRSPDNVLGRHRSNCQINFAGKTLVGDWETGKIYSMDLDIFTDNGDLLPAIRVCPHLTNDTKYMLYHALELTMQTGVGLTVGQGSDPQAMLRWSDDGGYSWHGERLAPIGKIGERKARVRWTRLGRSRDRLFEVTVTDPVRRVFTDASLAATPCLT